MNSAIRLFAAAVLGGRCVVSAPSEADASRLLSENLVVISGVPPKRSALVVAGAMSSLIGHHYNNSAELYPHLQLKAATHRVCANTVCCFTLFSLLHGVSFACDAFLFG